MKVNLLDRAFAHVPYSVPGRVSKDIEWVRHITKMERGPTVITDEMLRPQWCAAAQKQGPLIGWLLEGRAYGARNYDAIPSVIDSLDMLLTHDAALLAQYPEKARFVPFGGCWIPDEKWGMKPKTKETSMIYSAKNFMEGHQMRHAVAANLDLRELDLYGHGCGRPIKCKSEGLADYKFSVVIENDRADNYFTEKLIDCFAVGTVPIYWGALNIGDYFDADGIIEVDDWEDVQTYVESCDPNEDWEEWEPARRNNLETARRYVLPEDSIFPLIKEL